MNLILPILSNHRKWPIDLLFASFNWWRMNIVFSSTSARKRSPKSRAQQIWGSAREHHLRWTHVHLIWWVRQYVIMCFIDSCTYRDSELISDYLLSFFKLFAWIYMYKHKNTFTCFVSCKLHNVVSFNIYLTFSILYLFAPEVSHM